MTICVCVRGFCVCVACVTFVCASRAWILRVRDYLCVCGVRGFCVCLACVTFVCAWCAWLLCVCGVSGFCVCVMCDIRHLIITHTNAHTHMVVYMTFCSFRR